MPARRVDLQAHSVYSDGTCTPQEIVERAASKDLAAVALTDHDTVEGVHELHGAGEALDVETVAGVELSVQAPNQGVDVLGYLIDPDDRDLQAVLATARSHREERLPRMLDRLEQLGVGVERDQVEAHASGAVLGRPHIARAMVEAGHVSTVDEAFERFLGSRAPGYVPKRRLEPEEAIGAIHAAGGVAVLAHPCFVHPAALPHVLERLLEAGLDGIEVWYSEHDATHVAHFSRLAEQHGLVKTGGSDFHGANKPGIEVGTGYGDLAVPYEALASVRSAGSQS